MNEKEDYSLPTLHVELLLNVQNKKSPFHDDLDIYEEIENYVRDAFIKVKIGTEQQLEEADCLNSFPYAESICFGAYTGPCCFEDSHVVKDMEIKVHAYTLYPDLTGNPRGNLGSYALLAGTDNIMMQTLRILHLPNVRLKRDWKSLVFDDNFANRLFHTVLRLVDIMKHPGLDPSAFSWNRVILLHGRAGSGKTTLCRALAQKLSIAFRRMVMPFSSTLLVEINANGLFSSFFSQSGKNVEQIFDYIHELAVTKERFICVLIDEVETIAGKRENAMNGRECGDGLRATNQLLTALDRFRTLPNVLLLCTSNLVDAIDSAFLNRVDLKYPVPTLSEPAIYRIFRSCFEELVRSGVVLSNSGDRDASSEVDALVDDDTDEGTEGRELMPSKATPELNTTRGRITELEREEGASLKVLSRMCVGLSGRQLRRLPVVALANQTWGGQPTLADAMFALTEAINLEVGNYDKPHESGLK